MSLKTRNKVSALFSMASLTDIVFLLLIFFMLTSSMVSPNALKLLLPSSDSQTRATQTISVSIDKNLQYSIGTKKVQKKDLRKILAQNVGDVENNTVVLNAQKSVPLEEVVYVMDIVNDLRLKMILATKPKK